MPLWLGLVLAAVTCAALVLLLHRPAAASAAPDESDAPPAEPPAGDGHTLAVTSDGDRLAPIPRPPATPDLRPGMYTFGYIWRWDGRAWHLETPPDCEPITRIFGIGQTVWATGWNELWRRDASGWSKQYAPVRLYALHGWSEARVMCGGNRTVFAVDGDALKPIGTTPSGISALWGPSPDDVWVVGWNGMIMRWRGGAWIAEESGVEGRLTGVFGQDGEIVVVGEDAVALRSRGDGVWIREAIPEREGYPHSLSALWGDGRGVYYAVTSGGAILARRGGAWAVEATTDRQLLAIGGRGADDVFALGLQGHVWRSRGQGDWRDEGGAKSNSLQAVHRQGDDLFIGGDWFFEVS